MPDRVLLGADRSCAMNVALDLDSARAGSTTKVCKGSCSLRMSAAFQAVLG